MPMLRQMFRPLDSDDHADDSAVRATISRLRWSIVAAVAGTAALALLGVVAARVAWSIGLERGGELAAAASVAQIAKRRGVATDASTELPSAMPHAELLLVAVVAAAAIVTVGVFLAVRAPYARTRWHAVELASTSQQLADATLETFAALNAAVEAKDRYTAGHGLRVTLVSILIGQELDLTPAQLDVLRLAATFHDIGKIAVPDQVLQKPGRLTDAEFEAMKVHPAEGARICSKLQSLRPAVPLVRSHHERMDGRGYPDGLVAEQIPIGARIIAVADTWDAITSDRPYREGQPAFVALEEIRRCSGAQFDERVVRAFIEVLAKDPWMFGLTPEDVTERGRPLPSPVPASRGVDDDDDGYADVVGADFGAPREIDWSSGFDEDDLRAA